MSRALPSALLALHCVAWQWDSCANSSCRREVRKSARTGMYYTVRITAKLSMSQAVEAHRVARRRGSHIFYTIGSQISVRCQPYAPAGHPLPPRKIPGNSFLLEAKSTTGP
jgi:hypothetical protein